jgi:chromatin remodeling complex protein RSC6
VSGHAEAAPMITLYAYNAVLHISSNNALYLRLWSGSLSETGTLRRKILGNFDNRLEDYMAAKKPAAKKPAAKKPAAKKPAAKKPAAKKPAAKKPAAKKPAAKKPAAKKAAPKKPAAKRKPNAAFMKPMTISSVLGAVIGANPMPRTEVTKKLWDYIKKNKLQDAINKRMINADEKLKAVFGGKKVVSMFEMTKLVSSHLK